MSVWVYARYARQLELSKNVVSRPSRGRPPNMPMIKLEPEMCECGRGPKVAVKSTISGCAECNRLDGNGPRQRDIINVLRASGCIMSTTSIANELDMNVNTAQVILTRMLKSGVLGRRMLDNATQDDCEAYYYIERNVE